MSATRLRKWYFGINQRGLETSTQLVRTAVKSCLLNTGLEPHCLYFGDPIPKLQRLKRLGVKVIHHTPSLHCELRAAYGADYLQYAGHWLRIDIPEIETEDDVALYTDIDVIFRSMPTRLELPGSIAVAPEHQRGDWAHFNSGVILMNLPALRERDAAFKQAIRDRLAADFSYPTHDQASYNTFFAQDYDRLPLTMNWKPYWGINADAHIIHFHGPKPRLVAKFQTKGPSDAHARLASVWRRQPRSYAHYTQVYFELAKRRDIRRPDVPPVTWVGERPDGALRSATRRVGQGLADGLYQSEDGISRLLSSLRSIWRSRLRR